MIDFNTLLSYISPDCSYDEWVKVGMALKHEGADVSVWDSWSSLGSKYRRGECVKKWKSFKRDDVTGGTLHHIAKEHGYIPDTNNDFDIHNLLLDEVIVDPTFVSSEKIPEAGYKYDALGDMKEYFKALFEPDDFVGLGLEFIKDEKGKFRPVRTQYRRTAGDIIQKLETLGSIDLAIGKTDPEAGAFVRFNPLNGEGEKDENVTRFKYCLLESDDIPVDKQYGLIKAMNLPCKFIINSGGKSIHAIVKIDADNLNQYRQRVSELYEFAEKSGFAPDANDKNASRFSRLPGVKRGSKWQYIVDRDIGAESYNAWIEWRQEQADDLPADTSLASVWDSMPELKEELIPGVLRVGHKLLLAGPSKAGKSFLLMNLAVSMAEGVEWLGMKCRQGRVCYVNLELDEASCFHRFREIYERRGLEPKNIDNIDIWNLRGHSVPMDRLAPVLIHRFKDKNFEAVIIDPIYKVITGDENNATEMSKFCSYFDRVATEMGVAPIYCHHHSKGASGKYSNAADRSSGSGVFARDPDAILDLSELRVEEEVLEKYLDQTGSDNEGVTAWELSGTLREFPPIKPTRLWFDFPCHVRDEWNFLANAKRSDSRGDDAKGGRPGNAPEDWIEIADNLLTYKLDGDNCLTLDELGISASNAKRKFGPKTMFTTVKVNGETYVKRRDGTNPIICGKEFEKTTKGFSEKPHK